jgi:tetratricopeptide (TPR) repeat protein
VGDREFKADVLLIPALLVEECARLAKEDDSLATEAREAFIAKCEADAAHRRTQSGLAADQWAAALLVGAEGRALRVAYQGGELANAFAKEMERPTMPPCLSKATCECQRQLFRKLVQASEVALADDPSLYHVSLMISMAPEPLRDVDLALRLSRRASDLAPDDADAKIVLSLALYRAKDYRACLDLYENTTSPLSGEWGPMVSTLALLKTGKLEDARATYEGVEKSVMEYRQQCEEVEERGHFSIPSMESVLRMKAEVDAGMNSSVVD